METWVPIKEYQDLLLERVKDGIAKITINRPEVRNAFRPQTIMELIDAFALCRADTSIGVVILTGQGPEAFCSGADLKIGHGGYIAGEALSANILDVQRQIRTLPKPVIAMVAGYAIGGGHVLHVVCDLTIAAENARFGQTGPKVGSFDAGLGSSYLATDRRTKEGGDPSTAVCMACDTKLRLEGIPEKMQKAYFITPNEDVTFTRVEHGPHHDGVRFSNGAEVTLQQLGTGVHGWVYDALSSPLAVRDTEEAL